MNSICVKKRTYTSPQSVTLTIMIGSVEYFAIVQLCWMNQEENKISLEKDEEQEELILLVWIGRDLTLYNTWERNDFPKIQLDIDHYECMIHIFQAQGAFQRILNEPTFQDYSSYKKENPIFETSERSFSLIKNFVGNVDFLMQVIIDNIPDSIKKQLVQ